jgi:hypothetical protein
MSAPAGQPLIPSSAMADPSATRFPFNIFGQGSTLVVLHEAREYFSLGYDVGDPATSERADVGAVPVPSFACKFESAPSILPQQLRIGY